MNIKGESGTVQVPGVGEFGMSSFEASSIGSFTSLGYPSSFKRNDNVARSFDAVISGFLKVGCETKSPLDIANINGIALSAMAAFVKRYERRRARKSRMRMLNKTKRKPARIPSFRISIHGPIVTTWPVS